MKEGAKTIELERTDKGISETQLTPSPRKITSWLKIDFQGLAPYLQQNNSFLRSIALRRQHNDATSEFYKEVNTFGETLHEIGRRLGRESAGINYIRLLGEMPPEEAEWQMVSGIHREREDLFSRELMHSHALFQGVRQKTRK